MSVNTVARPLSAALWVAVLLGLASSALSLSGPTHSLAHTSSLSLPQLPVSLDILGSSTRPLGPSDPCSSGSACPSWFALKGESAPLNRLRGGKAPTPAIEMLSTLGQASPESVPRPLRFQPPSQL